MAAFMDLTGQKFGRLDVILRVCNNKWGSAQWLCICECGKEKILLGQNLINSGTKSCGCLHIENTIKRSTKHGHSRRHRISRAYSVWNDMIKRCTNPNNKRYADYGGRGITVCKKWLKFLGFLEDMGNPKNELTLDRIDNNKGYYKANCRWATRKEQQRNTRANRLLTYDNKTQCLTEWSEEINISFETLRWRFNNGWSVEKTLTTPVSN